jgi:TonB family protein
VSNTGRTSTGPGHERPSAAAPGTRRREAWLLSADDLLLIELGPLLGDRYRTHPIDDAEALHRASADGWLLLLDVVDVADGHALAARLASRYPQAALIVFCADHELAAWKSPPAPRSVCAVLERNALQGPALTRALLEAERRLESAATADTSDALPRLDQRSANPLRRLLPLVGLCVAAALAVGGYLSWRTLTSHEAAPQAARPGATPITGMRTGAESAPPAMGAPGGMPATGVTTAPAIARSVEDLLSDARSAFRDERLQLPRMDGAPQGDSALELYGQVLRQAPKNEEALDGLRRLLAVTRDRVQNDLRTERLDEAAVLIAAYRNAGLGSDELARMEREVSAARPRQMLQRSRTALAAGDLATAGTLAGQAEAAGADAGQLAAVRRDLGQRSAEATLATLAMQARTAIAAGNLLEPAADSARARLQAMQQAGRGQPPTLAVTHELQQALLLRAQLATRSNDPHPAEPWLAAAAELGATPELQTAVREQQAALEDQARRAAAATLPTRPAATAVPGPAPGWFAARPRRPLTIRYPSSAVDRAQSGYVIVEFTLGADGQAIAPQVLESKPAGTFDAPALEAVRQGRFDISPPAGQPATGLHARLRVGFHYVEGAQAR